MKKGLVILETDIQAGLMLFYQRTLEDESFHLRIGYDIVEISGVAAQEIGLEIPGMACLKVGSDPLPKALCLPDVDDSTRAVFKEVHAGRSG